MIDYTVRHHVAEILFNHAPANTINHAFLDTLIAMLQQAGADKEVRAILIGSAIPDRFCAGLDLTGLLRGSHADGHDIVDKLYARLTDGQFGLTTPSIAAISGACGALVPLLLKKLGADPVIASSIFLTTATNVASMAMLLGLATLLVK